jgi:hypothetical protein
MNAMDILRAKKVEAAKGVGAPPKVETKAVVPTEKPTVAENKAPVSDLLQRLRAKAAAPAQPAVGIVPPDAPKDDEETIEPAKPPAAPTLEAAKAVVDEAKKVVEDAKTVAAAPDESKTVRRPKGYAEKLPALGYTKTEIDGMSAADMRRIIDGNIRSGTQREANPVDVDAALNEAEAVPDEIAELSAGVAEGVLKLSDVAEAIVERLATLPEIVQQAILKAMGAKVGEVTVPVEETELTLYVDCAPDRGEPVVHLEDILKPFMDKACTETGEAYYSLIGGGYGKGAAYVAAQLEDAHKKQPYVGSIVCWTMFPATKQALEFLYPVADRIVRAR